MKRPRSAALCLAALIATSMLIGPAQAAGGFTIRVSLPVTGAEPDRASQLVSITPDGRYVVFRTSAFNMHGDLATSPGLYVRDRRTGTTEQITATWDNDYLRQYRRRTITPDGRLVVFSTDEDLFVFDRSARTTERVLPAGIKPNGAVNEPSISADGRYVSFISYATNLVPNDTNGWPDVFWVDRSAGRIERVSAYPDGSEAPTNASSPGMDATGSFVAFRHCSSLLPGTPSGPPGSGSGALYVRDMRTSELRVVSVSDDGFGVGGTSPALSSDGRHIAFVSASPEIAAGDTNGIADVFVRDMATGVTRLASVATTSGTGNGYSLNPSVSDDGQVVAFSSDATNLMAGDTAFPDIFIRDFRSGSTRRASAGPNGMADAQSFAPMLTADGSQVAYSSDATNLVAGDTNEATDVFTSRPYGEAPDAPVISFPVEGMSVEPSFTVGGTSDPGARIEVREGTSVLGHATAGDTGSWSLHVSFIEGAHTITATATDPFGLAGPSTQRSFLVEIDATPPEAPVILQPAPGSLHARSLTVAGTAEPGTLVEVIDGNGTAGSAVADGRGDWSASATLGGDGSRGLAARARDAAGNTGDLSDVVQVIVDGTAPTATIDAADGAVFVSNAGLAGTAADAHGVSRVWVRYFDALGRPIVAPDAVCTGCGVDSSVPVVWRAALPSERGLIRVELIATDLVGNTSKTVRTILKL